MNSELYNSILRSDKNLPYIAVVILKQVIVPNVSEIHNITENFISKITDKFLNIIELNWKKTRQTLNFRTVP